MHDKDNSNTLQRAALEAAAFVRDVCERHGLCYSLAFGSLIGAVRHGGFIPWDDDLDFLMPRPDYEKFLDVVAQELPEHYELQNYRMGTHMRYVTRIADKRVSIHLDSYGEEASEMFAWIDIFVLDGLPDGWLARHVHYARIQWHKAMCSMASFDQTVNRHRPGRPKYQQAIIDFCAATHFGSWMDAQKCLDKYDRALRRYSFGEYDTCVCGVGTYHPRRQTWARSAFENTEDLSFEDTVFAVPVDYDGVLRTTYGDYMTLPSDGERLVHQITTNEA